jgi:hypothetical protein
VLGALRRRDEHRVHRRAFVVLAHRVLAFVDDAGDAVAVLAFHFLVEALEHLLQLGHVSVGFFEMVDERFHQLFFGVVGIAQFVEESVVKCGRFGHDLSFNGVGPRPGASAGRSPIR